MDAQHNWGPEGSCYDCEDAPGGFSVEVDDDSEAGYHVDHLCSRCVARR